MTRQIEISIGRRDRHTTPKIYALVSDEDYDRVAAFRWTAIHTGRKGGGYAMRAEFGTTILMHRFIMDAPEGSEVDHINHNTLDNRRENLRVVTLAQNRANKSRYTNNTSGYKGVSKSPNGKYRMQFQVFFDDPIEAAKAWDKVARIIHGDHASLNFPEQP